MMFSFVKMQILPAMCIDFSTISRAESFVFSTSAVPPTWRMVRPNRSRRLHCRARSHLRSAQNECVCGIRYQQQRVQMAQHFVRAPILRQLDDTSRQIAVVLLQLAFKA